MEDIKVSVIISVYNVESYLKRCLDSIINQTLNEIEIICIDDCSIDNSYNILEEYKIKDDRIIVLKNEKNTGSSCRAFNTGIEIAKGEYIHFMDFDDYVSNDFLYNLYNTAKKYDSDITYTLNVFEAASEDSLKRPWYSKIEEWGENLEDISNITMQNTYISKKEFIQFVCWNKIIRLEFIRKNNIRFYEISSGIDGGGTDIYFTFKCILNSPKTSYNHKSIYYYTVRDDSLYRSVKINPKKIISNIERKKDLIEYSKNNFETDTIHIYPHFWRDVYNRFLMINENDKSSIYSYVHNFAEEIECKKVLEIKEEEKDYYKGSYQKYYKAYLLIKNNDTYEKYIMQKELFDNIDGMRNKINNLDTKLNNLDAKINNLDAKINQFFNKEKERSKLFGISNLQDKKIIYLFGIKMTFKK